MFLLKKAARSLRFIGAYMLANTQAAMEYRVSFWVQIITMIASDSLWLFFWWTYFHQFPLVHGWQSTDIVVLWAVSACGFGISFVLFNNTTNLAALIMSGGLDAYLSMPRNVLLHASIGTSNPAEWGDILFGLGVYLLVLRPDLPHFALFVLLAFQVSLIFSAFMVILGSLAFFLGNVEGLAQQMLGALVSFSTYPMNIFHGFVKVLLFTVVPAGFISFVPLQLLHQVTLPLLAAMFGFTLLITSLAVAMFSLGLRRYESGNLMGMQN
ncbi:MAG: ABC-2 family transporter protein [Chloroflexota bacterium]|nr:ABC-2 family transporter protein [Chloroflexota bacterium]